MQVSGAMGMLGTIRSGSPLVGREEELAAAHDVLGSAREGRGALVAITGEAGIGKSRLCRELAAYARAQGFVDLLGVAHPGDSDCAYAPIQDTLRRARRQRWEALWTAAGARAPVLQSLLPELGPFPSSQPAPLNQPLLFETLIDAVLEGAGERPMLWTLEDLHWSDPGTWAFVAYAARRLPDLPLLLLVTYRDDQAALDPPGRGRVETLRESHVVRVQLERLSRREAGALAGSLGPHLPPPVLDRVAARSAGNPLLLEELIACPTALQPGSVPERVRQLAVQRVRDLDDRVRGLLELAAAAGAEVDAGLLLDLRPGPELLDRAAESGLAMLAGAQGERFTFRHPLLREAIHAATPAGRRRQLHAELARAVQAREPDRHEQVSRHLELAGDPTGALAILEGGMATARGQAIPGRAASLGLAAWNLVRRHPFLQRSREEVYRVLLDDLFLAGRWTEVEEVGRQRWPERDRLDRRSSGILAHRLVMALFFQARMAEAWQMARAELERREAAGDLESAPDLLASTAFLTGFAGMTDEAARLSMVTVELARRCQEPQVVHWARFVEVWLRWLTARDREAAARDHLANAELSRRAGRLDDYAQSLFSTTRA